MLRDNIRSAWTWFGQSSQFSLSIMGWSLSVLASVIVFVLALAVTPTIIASSVGGIMFLCNTPHPPIVVAPVIIWIAVFGIEVMVAIEEAKGKKR